MKKLLAIVLAILISLSIPAFAEEENWYLNTAKELAIMVGEFSRDEGYQEMMGGHFDVIDTIKTADFENILSAWRYGSPATDSMVSLLSIASNTPMCEAAQKYLADRFLGTIVSMHNSRYGAENLAAATVISYSCTYVMPDDFAPCIIALELDHAAIAVSFIQTGDDTITATACPLFGSADESFSETVQSLNGPMPMLIKKQIF